MPTPRVLVLLPALVVTWLATAPTSEEVDLGAECSALERAEKRAKCASLGAFGRVLHGVAGGEDPALVLAVVAVVDHMAHDK